MSHESDKVKDVFDQAVECKSAEQRRVYLESACKQNPQLRSEVESLLDAYEQAGELLEDAPVALVATADSRLVLETVGTRMGQYILREQIAEGGMGVVYVAEQTEPVARKVALKVIKPGMGTKQVIARFEAERQALALMDHPNIDRVLDAGSTESGRPYFVMDLVRGLPITEYCDKQKLNTRQRLELFVTVCEAVQHAHQKGIIHRDIKPSNLLVTRNGERAVPKVIDFGVAKATNQRLTEQTIYTHFSQMIGTPLYMSPEQAEMSELDVDTRGDIYSLGVLLYELLTGSTPFERERLRSVDYDEIRRIICEEEPPRPSDRVSTLAAEALSTISDQRRHDPQKLSQTYRGELDWIVIKALEKDRARRYETASAFADDVLRYLNGESVQACPPTVAYRMQKFVRRHRIGLSATVVAAVVLTLMTTGLAISNWRTSQERDEKQMALMDLEQALTEKEEALGRAEDNFRMAREAVDQYLTRVSEKDLANTPLLQPLRKDLLELALEYYHKFIAEQRNDPDLQAELAAAYYRVAKITAEIGTKDSFGESLKSHNQALDIRKQLVLENPDNENYRRQLAESYLSISELQNSRGTHHHYDDALAAAEAAVATAMPLVKPDHRHTLAKCYLQLAEVNARIFVSRQYLGAQRGKSCPSSECQESARKTGERESGGSRVSA